MMWGEGGGGAQFKSVIYFYDKSIDKIQKVVSTKSKERMSGKKKRSTFSTSTPSPLPPPPRCPILVQPPVFLMSTFSLHHS